MSVNPVFGRIFTPAMLENQIKDLLVEWFQTFIREACSQLNVDPDTVPVPKEQNFTSRNSFDALPGEELPKVVVIAPGLIGSPKKSGNGKYRATWRLGVGVATAATDEETAKLYTDIYGSAARDIILKRGGGATGGYIEWLDSQSVDLPIIAQNQKYKAVSVFFSVDIDNVASSRGGPITPNAEPYVPNTAQTVDITLVKEPQ